MQIPYYHVDAFTGQAFGGNPAGVCLLDEWLPDEIMQRMAAEHRLSETAFTVKKESGYELRWFTPTTEIDLCGHATLATAHVLWRHAGESSQELTFATKSGPLTVIRRKEQLVMDFPSRPAQSAAIPVEAAEILSQVPLFCGKARDYLFLFEDEETIRSLRPDFARMMKWDEAFAVIVTAPGREVDFVSRFFAPGAGVDEDPVTGSAHCTLIPFWAERLGKKMLHARQVSARGGNLFCEDRGERVLIGGEAITYLQGTIEI